MDRDGTLVKDTDEAVKMVREREFVFITDGPLLKHISNQPPCDLKIGKYHVLPPLNFSLSEIDLSIVIQIATNKSLLKSFHLNVIFQGRVVQKDA